MTPLPRPWLTLCLAKLVLVGALAPELSCPCVQAFQMLSHAPDSAGAAVSNMVQQVLDPGPGHTDEVTPMSRLSLLLGETAPERREVILFGGFQERAQLCRAAFHHNVVLHPPNHLDELVRFEKVRAPRQEMLDEVEVEKCMSLEAWQVSAIPLERRIKLQICSKVQACLG